MWIRGARITLTSVCHSVWLKGLATTSYIHLKAEAVVLNQLLAGENGNLETSLTTIKIWNWRGVSMTLWTIQYRASVAFLFCIEHNEKSFVKSVTGYLKFITVIFQNQYNLVCNIFLIIDKLTRVILACFVKKAVTFDGCQIKN